MKQHNISFSFIFTSLLSAILLASCTLIDNDLRDLHDIPGYDNVVHIEDENMTCDYQYQDNTIVMDQRYEQYIQSIDYENHKLYMYDYTPEEMMPKIGQPLISPQNAKLEWGIMHTPTKITREGDLYVLELERTTLDAVFKEFSLDGEWDLMQEEEYEVDPSDTTYSVVSDNAWANTWTRADGFKDYGDQSWHEVDILPVLGVLAGAAMPNKHSDKATAAAMLGGNWNFSWPRNVERDSKGKLKNSSDGFAIKATVTGAFKFRWKSLCKVKQIIKTEGRKVEVVADVGSEIQIIPQITGKIELSANFWDILKLPNPKFGPLAGPLPVFIVIEPAIDFSFSFEGTLGYKWTKTFRTEYAAYNNISGEKDGVSIKNKNTPIKRESVNEIQKWEGESNNSLDMSLEAGAGVTAKVVFGSPEDYPNVGLSAGFHVGARFKTVIDNKNNYYGNCIHFGIPLRLTGTFFLNIWDGLTLDWSYADAIAKLAGKEEGAEWEFAKTDFRVFPSIDNMSIVCTNKDELFTPPNYKISFQVLDQGMKMWDNIRPVLNIYLHDDKKDVIVKIDDKKPTVDPKRYEWTLHDLRIVRGVYYDAEVSWVEKRDVYDASSDEDSPQKTGKTRDKVYCSKRFTFSSESPTVVIDDVTTTMQKRYYSEKRIVKVGNDWTHDVYFDYGFRTHQRFTGLNNIKKWGFTVNGKNYTIDNPPPSNEVSVVWKITKQKIKKELTMTPFIIPKNMDTWVYGPAKKITLEYDGEQNDYNDVWVKIKDKGYYTSGFDLGEEYKESTDVVMDDVLKARMRDGKSGDNDNGGNNRPQEIVIELDE